MELIETFGVVIGIQRDVQLVKIVSIEIFTFDYGIMRWFNRSCLEAGIDYLFESIEITGAKTTETAGNLQKIKIISQDATAMKENGSYEHGKIFVETLRKITFDGFPLQNLFLITRQAIKNFASGFDANVVLLKALYLLCKEEGYAVDAEWMESLGSEDKILACCAISSQLSTDPISGAGPDRICILTDLLRQWALSL
jgi:hypothetical protein